MTEPYRLATEDALQRLWQRATPADECYLWTVLVIQGDNDADREEFLEGVRKIWGGVTSSALFHPG